MTPRVKPPDGGDPPGDEIQEYVPDDPDVPSLPLGQPDGLHPEGHLSFNQFWASLGFPADPDHERLRELFYEWLGQRGFDVHLRDEPTILGDMQGWLEIWMRYRQLRKLK